MDIDRFCNTQLYDFYIFYEPFVLTRKLQITACNGVSIEDSYLQILFLSLDCRSSGPSFHRCNA